MAVVDKLADVLLELQTKNFTEDEYAEMTLWLDRIRARMSYNINKRPDSILAPTSGHQPSCDGKCIATRGNKND